MKKLLTAAALSLLVTACTQTSASSGGMMQGDMMKNCQAMMKDGQMDCCKNMMQSKNGMSGDMMKQCQMMQNSSAAPADDQATPSGASAEDHKKHHPAQ